MDRLIEYLTRIKSRLDKGDRHAIHEWDNLMKQLENEVEAGIPGSTEKLLYLREISGLCYLCGLQGVIRCCNKIRCGEHASEHLAQIHLKRNKFSQEK